MSVSSIRVQFHRTPRRMTGLQYPSRNAVGVSGEIMVGTLLSIETLFSKPVLPKTMIM